MVTRLDVFTLLLPIWSIPRRQLILCTTNQGRWDATENGKLPNYIFPRINNIHKKKKKCPFSIQVGATMGKSTRPVHPARPPTTGWTLKSGRPVMTVNWTHSIICATSHEPISMLQVVRGLAVTDDIALCSIDWFSLNIQ